MKRVRRKNTDPWRAVTSAMARQANCINNNSLQTTWWDLTLECGHYAERPLRFPSQEGTRRARQGFAALHHPRPKDEALPPPKRVRCAFCAAAERKAAQEKMT